MPRVNIVSSYLFCQFCWNRVRGIVFKQIVALVELLLYTHHHSIQNHETSNDNTQQQTEHSKEEYKKKRILYHF
jgi:hypothetical protein